MYCIIKLRCICHGNSDDKPYKKYLIFMFHGKYSNQSQIKPSLIMLRRLNCDRFNLRRCILPFFVNFKGLSSPIRYLF